MGDVYNRKLFQAKARPARKKLAQMAGIMASSPELMQAANQGSDKTPTPPSTGGARPMMAPPPAPMMAPPPQPMAPRLPQVPMQTAMAPAPMMQAPAPMMQAPAPRPMAPAPMPQQQPVKFDEGGGVNIVDPATAIQTGAVEMGMSLYDKLKEMYGSEEKVKEVVAEKDKKIDDAQKTGDPAQISDAILDAAGVKPTKENKMDFAANVLNLKDVNDLNEIDNRIAQASLAVGVGKRVGGDTAIAEAVLLGLQNYKQTAAARAAGAGGGVGSRDYRNAKDAYQDAFTQAMGVSDTEIPEGMTKEQYATQFAETVVRRTYTPEQIAAAGITMGSMPSGGGKSGPTLEEFLVEAQKANPNTSVEELTEFYTKKYGG